MLNFMAEAGFFGVELFFFISGFCLFYPYARARVKGSPMPGVRRFFTRRLLKIAPSYILALAVFAIVYRTAFASPADAALQIGSHLAFVHTMLPTTYGGISGPLWTIGVEVQFYLLFPLFVAAFARRPVVGYLVLIAVAECYRLSIGMLGLSSMFGWLNQLPAFLDIFGAGMLAAHFFATIRARSTETSFPFATVGSIAGLVLMVGACGIASAISDSQSVDAMHVWLNAHRILVGPLCFATALPTLFAATQWRSIIGSRVLVLLSAISYNLYLWNLEVMVWVHNAGFSPVGTFILGVAAAIGIALLVTYAFERPILEQSWSSYRRLAAAIRARFPVPAVPARFSR